MTLPAGFPYPLNQVVEIPLEQIIPNPDQPRRSMRQEPLETLAASMKAKGQLTEAKVRPLTEAERVSNPGVWVMLVGGHRRRLAALKNGFKTLKCTVHDITPEDTHYQALMDNDHEAMDWWDWDIAIEKESKTFPGTLEDLGARLDKGMTKVYGALKIGKALNPAARALVDENLEKTLKNDLRPAKSKNKGFLITENTLLVLADLEDPDQVQQALQLVLDDYLTTDQAQKLVEHMQAGEPVETFSPHKPVPPKPKAVQPASHPDTPPELSNHPTHHLSESQPASGDPHQAAAHSHPVHTAPAGPAQAPPDQPADNWFWKMMVGIKFFNQLRSKVKKGEPLTGWEKCFVWAHAGLKALGEFLKILRKIFGPIVKTIGHAAKKALGETLSGLLVLLFRIALICLLVWAVIKVIDYGFVYPWHWVEHKVESIFHHEDISPAQTPIPTPQPIASTILPKMEAVVTHFAPQKKVEKTSPVMTYQPSVSFAPSSAPAQTLYDPKLLEQEIAALPKNCIVKSFPVLTDEGMPGDLAVSRMQGVTDPDKYTMMLGSGKQQIQSINTTTTNLIVNYKSTDPFNMFNGPGQLNYFWEDVLYIHTDEIDVEDKTPYTIYQLSLVVSGSKYALTIQCATAADLEHLVSTMQYFIRNSRLGHDTALAGMPYPHQGLVLNNDCMVDKLWADSPMWNAGSDMEPAQPNHVAQLGASQQVKAGISLGDHFWSVGKITAVSQSRSDLEAGLQSLPVTFYYVTASEWDRAMKARNPNQSNGFRPRLRKISIGQ